jgi:hypothetical protein
LRVPLEWVTSPAAAQVWLTASPPHLI